MTGTVILRPGHPPIGEVKSLSRGSLRFDTREMDLVGIRCDDVALLTTAQSFEISSRDGRRLLGTPRGRPESREAVTSPAEFPSARSSVG